MTVCKGVVDGALTFRIIVWQQALVNTAARFRTKRHHTMHRPFLTFRIPNMRSPRLVYRVAALLPLLLLVHSPLAAQRTAAPVRIGLVDSRKLLQEMPGRAQAESQFALEMANARTLVHSATDSMRAAVDELSRTEADLRPQQRESAMMIMRARELALEDMVSQLNLITSKRLEELQGPLIERMRVAVKAVRARERLALVFDLANMDGVVDWADELDITTLVLEELRGVNSVTIKRL